VSWRGDTDWNDRRLQIVLDAAQRLGLKVSILVETLMATEGPEGTVKPLSANKLRTWLEKAFDAFGGHAAFLRVNGRPVIFVYVADAFTPAQWVDIVGALARGGRNPFLMADSLDPTFLESFAGAFTYATALLPRSNLETFDNSQAIRTQSYNLAYGGEQRVDAATVSPGYNDTRLDRKATFVVGRDNGALYDAEWQAAVRAQPDWILVTSWNEFWENTHIEPSELYGHWYQSRTRVWSDLFRRQGNDRRPLSPLR
jgi:glycoprotein endo-alpha-1,2-mannosidase